LKKPAGKLSTFGYPNPKTHLKVNMEHNKDNEAIYVAQEDSHVVMSEKVRRILFRIRVLFVLMLVKEG
jgi:hypothetical protein